jgi:hypothetical protein
LSAWSVAAFVEVAMGDSGVAHYLIALGALSTLKACLGASKFETSAKSAESARLSLA